MKRTWVRWLGLAIVLLLAAGLVWLLWRTGFFSSLSSIEALQAYIQRFAPNTHLLYFGIQLASVVLAPIPSNLTAAAGAVLFGLWPAFFLTVAAVQAGSVLVFWLARTYGRSFADRFVTKKVSEQYLDLIRRKRDVFLAMTFLFPFFPDDLLCILAGLTDISFPRFFVLTLLTRPWGLLVACAVGSSTLSIPLWGMVLLGAAGLLFFLLMMKYGDKLESALLRHFQK